MTPGAYLQLRRKAAGLSLKAVAAAVATEPRLAEHARADWLQSIEAGDTPARFDTLVVLRNVYPFDFAVLEQLVQISLGDQDAGVPRLCRACACSDSDACRTPPFDTCFWVEPDLCSRCGDPRPPALANAA